MRRPDRERDSEIFWMKTPVIIITGLAVSILPAVAIITKSELGWYRVAGALLLCAICIGAPLEVWPESHWPGFALREADVFKTYMAWWCM